MMRFVMHFLFVGAAMMILSRLVPGFEVSGWTPALIAAVVLGLVNAIVRPILQILTFPITIVTLGLWLIVINAAMLWLTQWLVSGFTIQGVPALLIGTLALSLVGMVWKSMTRDESKDRA